MGQIAQLCRVVSSTYKKKNNWLSWGREKNERFESCWSFLPFPQWKRSFPCLKSVDLVLGIWLSVHSGSVILLVSDILESVKQIQFSITDGNCAQECICPVYFISSVYSILQLTLFCFVLSVMECSITAGKSVNSDKLGRSERTTKVRCCLRNSVEHLMRSIKTRKLDFPALRPVTWSHLLDSGFCKVGGSSSWEFSTNATLINSALINIPTWTRV